MVNISTANEKSCASSTKKQNTRPANNLKAGKKGKANEDTVVNKKQKNSFPADTLKSGTSSTSSSSIRSGGGEKMRREIVGGKVASYRWKSIVLYMLLTTKQQVRLNPRTYFNPWHHLKSYYI